MSEQKSVQYKLYALPVNYENVKQTADERFVRMTNKYILVYRTEGQPDNSAEITEDDVKRLTEADARWLYECNIEILAEETMRQQPTLLKDLSVKIARLESELREQKKIVSEVETDGERES